MTEATYSARDIARLLRIPERTLRRWIAEGLVTASARSGGYRPRPRYTIHDMTRARVAQALRSRGVGLRGKRLRTAVARTTIALRQSYECASRSGE